MGGFMAEIPVQKVATAEDRKLPVFAEVEQMMQRIRERAFGEFAGRGFAHGQELSDWLAAERELCWPASELTETPENFNLSIAMAGFDPKDIEVTATPREIIVRAKMQSTRTEVPKAKAEQVCWSEIRGSDVYRRVELPLEVRVEKVSAEYNNGMLKIAAPKGDSAANAVPVSAAA
jgi:HSP20 family protein